MKTPFSVGAKIASAIYDADGLPVCIVDSMQETSRADEIETARRIVACINACSAIPTVKLEAMADDPIEGLFGKLAGKAIGERSELLSVVESYEKAFEAIFTQCCSNPIFNTWGQQVSVSLLNEAHSKATTVIAKLKGQSL